MRISDWSSDVCSSDLRVVRTAVHPHPFAPSAARAACGLSIRGFAALRTGVSRDRPERPGWLLRPQVRVAAAANGLQLADDSHGSRRSFPPRCSRCPRQGQAGIADAARDRAERSPARSEEHTSELQSLMRISYAVFCLKKKTKQTRHNKNRVQ